MLRARRRLASIAVLATVGVSVLAGCRADPDIAAYVGDRTYTEARITQIYDNARTTLLAAVREQAAQRTTPPGESPSPAPDTVEMPITRQEIVIALVGRDMLKAVAEEKNIKPVDIPVEQIQQQLRLPAEVEYMQLWREHEGYRVGLLQGLRREPSEADLRDIYDRLLAANLVQPGTPFSDFRSNLPDQSRQVVAGMVAVRDEVVAKVRDGDVVVNPRYTPTEIVLLTYNDASQVSRPLVTVPLESQPGEPFVRDSTPPPAPPPTPPPA